MTNQRKQELRKVIWLDSNTKMGWHFPDETNYEPITITSVGWVISETDEYITLAGSVCFGDEYQAADAMTIPKVCIVSDKELTKR